MIASRNVDLVDGSTSISNKHKCSDILAGIAIICNVTGSRQKVFSWQDIHNYAEMSNVKNHKKELCIYTYAAHRLLADR